ncbi:MAG: rRNA pseudouridine synthase [Bacteroidales bacterium]|nr:rRNA pseudouridine synthase [Bacteroidales bacterium]
MSILKGSGSKYIGSSRKRGSKNISDSILKTSKRKTVKKIKQDKTKHHPFPEKEKIRLNRYIASTGLCSRRQADTYIKSGLITVNDKTVTELGTKIYPKDIVKYNGSKIKEEKKIYILLNKPKDYVTTVKDPHAAKTVLDLVKNACKERVYPVGRLDRTTTGVLLITNDGSLTKRLTHPKFNKLKVYQVTLDRALKAADLEKISKGITLEDGFIKADAISYVNPADKKSVGIEIHSGRNRIARRIFEHLDYRVLKLDRVYFAGLTKKGLSRGQWRFLTEREISMLKMSAYK